MLGVSDGCQTGSKWRQTGERAALNIKANNIPASVQYPRTIAAKDHGDRVSCPWVGFVRCRFIDNGGGTESAFGVTSL